MNIWINGMNVAGQRGMDGVEGKPGMDGVQGQSGMEGTHGSDGAHGQDVVSSSGSLNQDFMNQLVERLNSTHNQSFSMINDNGRLQIMLNGVKIVDLNINELVKNARDGGDPNK